MEQFDVQLFGRFAVRRNGLPLPQIDASKVQELFSYLILNRTRPHNRETLANILWGDGRSDQARKYLRQTLWQLQSSLESDGAADSRSVLIVDPGWVYLNSEANLVVDTAELEHAFALVRDVPGHLIASDNVGAIQQAVQLYQGDLLEGWYQDWCLIERERLQTMYLILLDKLMSFSEAHQEYETGMIYGHQILHIDRPREHTHRKLMRLYALSGDRSSALRQYERCVAALSEELDVEPARRTVDLYEQIRLDRLPESPRVLPNHEPAPLSDVAVHLSEMRSTLTAIDRQLQHDIQTIEQSLRPDLSDQTELSVQSY